MRGAESRQLAGVRAQRVDLRFEVGYQCRERLHDSRLAFCIQWHDVEHTCLSGERIACGSQVFCILDYGIQHRAGVGAASQPHRGTRDVVRAPLHILDDSRGTGARQQFVGDLHDIGGSPAHAAGSLYGRAFADDRRCPRFELLPVGRVARRAGRAP